jgi:probable rRNA maturation factor
MIHVTRSTALPKEMNLKMIRRIARQSFSKMKVTGDASIVFTDNRKIQSLNKEYRNIDACTDVLSFSSDEIDPMTNARYLGDIIISTDRAQEQSQQAGRPFFDELSMLIVHGCLHLSGLDHSTTGEKETMKGMQESILSSLGVINSSWPEDD